MSNLAFYVMLEEKEENWAMTSEEISNLYIRIAFQYESALKWYALDESVPHRPSHQTPHLYHFPIDVGTLKYYGFASSFE